MKELAGGLVPPVVRRHKVADRRAELQPRVNPLQFLRHEVAVFADQLIIEVDFAAAIVLTPPLAYATCLPRPLAIVVVTLTRRPRRWRYLVSRSADIWEIFPFNRSLALG